MTQTTARKPRRMARAKQTQAEPPIFAKAPSRLDLLQDLLTRDGGATIATMVEATGWQKHSVRGAMAGALKKRGLLISSNKSDGTRRYRAERAA